jgi:DNA-binding Lrp family transcriptional regulator
MALAFILINSEIGMENKVSEELKSINEVKVVYVVYGVYDLIARVEADKMDDLKNAISDKIRRLNNIRNTLTMIVVE